MGVFSCSQLFHFFFCNSWVLVLLLKLSVIFFILYSTCSLLLLPRTVPSQISHIWGGIHDILRKIFAKSSPFWGGLFRGQWIRVYSAMP